MAGIDHDQRPGVARPFRLRAEACSARNGMCGVVLQRDIAQKGLAAGRAQIDDQARRLALAGIDDESLVDMRRPGGIEHDARAALHDQAVAERLDQASPLLAGLGRQLEHDLRQIDHHPIGVGEGESGEIDPAVEIHDKAGLLAVGADPHVACHRMRIDPDGWHWGARDRLLGRHGRRVAKHGRRQKTGDREDALCHESNPFEAGFIPLGPVSVNGS